MKEKTVYTMDDGEIEVTIDDKTRERLEAQGVDIDTELRQTLFNMESKLNLDETRDTREFLKE